MNPETTTTKEWNADRLRDELSAALEAIARLLQYPEPDFEQRLQDARKALRELDVGGEVSAFERFCTTISALSSDEREELYTATFDVTPACVAYVSIHLFGEENFKRGEFMAAVRARYEQSLFDCRGELPDHISVLLRFAAAAGEEERRELTQFCLLGPLAKMIAGLASENPYRSLLETVLAILRVAHPGMDPALSPLDQMQRHAGACSSMTSGCGCGLALDQDPVRVNTLAAVAGKTGAIAVVPVHTNESHG